MISTSHLISISSSSFTNLLGIVTCTPSTINVTVTFTFHSFFSSQARSRYLFFFPPSFNFTLWSTRTVKSTIRQFFFLVVDYDQVWSSGQDYAFWVVNIPLVYIVKFKFLAQFPVDHLSHPVVSSLTLFLC